MKKLLVVRLIVMVMVVGVASIVVPCFMKERKYG